jgi:hypothetical protein
MSALVMRSSFRNGAINHKTAIQYFTDKDLFSAALLNGYVSTRDARPHEAF